MSEMKKTTLGILLLYVLSTTAFLWIIFSSWYFGEINALKIRSFREADKISKRIIQVMAQKGKYAYYINTIEGKQAVLRAISADLGHRFMVFDLKGELTYNNMGFLPSEIPQDEGIFIIDHHLILNTYGRPYFLSFEKSNYSKRKDEHFRIVIDSGDIGDLLWDLRLKIWGLFGILSLMMGVVGFLLVRLALKPLRQKIQDLDSFIKDTTHEINTPLSVLQMSIESIDQNRISPEDSKKFQYIQSASRTIENIYNSLVYISFGRVENEISEIQMLDLLNERVNFFAFLFEQKKIDLSFDLNPVSLKANAKSMTLAIDNLLSNAYKYTPKGGAVEIRLGKEEERAYLSIKDNGYGIKNEDLNKIFDRYKRFDRSAGGFGLGLNIVRRVCDEFGIQLLVKSEYKKGSEFILQWNA